MTPGQRTNDRDLTDSPTAWRVRIRVLDRQGLPAHVDSATLERPRVEISVPGVAPSRMYSDLWQWIHAAGGDEVQRDLVATIAAPGVEQMDIIFHEWQQSEHVLQLSSSQRLWDFAAGR